MNEEQRAKIVLKILNKTYPTTPIPLKTQKHIHTINICFAFSSMHRREC